MKSTKIMEQEKVTEKLRHEMESAIKHYNKKMKNIGNENSNFTSEKETLCKKIEILEGQNITLSNELNELRGK